MRPTSLVIASVIVVLLAWGLWPLGDARFEIRFDPAKTRTAKEFLALPSSQGSPPSHAMPNVVLIVADDLGKHDISVYGPSPTPTPNLVALAVGGRDLHVGLRHLAGLLAVTRRAPDRALSAALRLRAPHPRSLSAKSHRVVVRATVLLDARLARRSTTTAYRAPSTCDRQGIPPSELTARRAPEEARLRDRASSASGTWAPALTRCRPRAASTISTGSTTRSASTATPTIPSMIGVRGATSPTAISGGAAAAAAAQSVATASSWRSTGYLTDEDRRRGDRRGSPHIATGRSSRTCRSAPYTRRCRRRAKYVDRFAAHRPTRPACLLRHDRRARRRGRRDSRVARRELHLDENTIVVFLSDNGAASYTGIVDNAPAHGRQAHELRGRHQRAVSAALAAAVSRRHDVHAPGLDPRRLHDDRAVRPGSSCRPIAPTTASISSRSSTAPSRPTLTTRFSGAREVTKPSVQAATSSSVIRPPARVPCMT